ncbi:hypothetical protein JW968_02870 [Candidatus Woesearchaeota archaeon]|nr:hypothetical protein [Candidatus Woesearchaeota archaeon]
MAFSAVPAFAADFDAFTSFSGARTCSCSVFEYKVYVTNNEIAGASFNIGVDSGISGWMSFAPKLFYLAPGETGEVTVFVNIPCGEKGTSRIDTIIYSGDTEKTIRNELEYRSCPNVNIIAKNYAQDIVSCSPAEFEFEILNTGSFVETYYLGVDDYEDHATLSKNPVILLPGEKEEVFLFFDSLCAEKDVKIEFFADASRNMIRGSVPLYVDMIGIVPFEVDFPDEIKTCLNAKSGYTLGLKNGAGKTETFSVSSDAGFVSFSESDFELGPDASKSITVYVEATSPIQDSFDIDISSGSSGKTVIKAFVDVEECDFLMVDMPSELTSLQCESKSQNIVIKNLGESSDMALVLSGPEWVSLNSPQSLKLAYGQEISLSLYLDIPCDAHGQYDLSLEAKHIASGKSVSKSLSVSVFNKSESYQISFGQEKILLKEGMGSASLPVRNTGFKNATYVFSIDSPDWIILATDKLDLSPEEQGIVYINVSLDNVSREDYNLTLTAHEVRGGSYYSQAYDIGFSSGSDILLYMLIGGAILLIILIILVAVLVSRKGGKGKKDEKKSKKEEKKSKKEEKKEEKIVKVRETPAKARLMGPEDRDWLMPFRFISVFALVSVILIVLLMVFSYAYYILYFPFIIASIALLIIAWLIIFFRFRPKKAKKPLAEKPAAEREKKAAKSGKKTLKEKKTQKGPFFPPGFFGMKFWAVAGIIILIALLVLASVFFYVYLVVYLPFIILGVVLLIIAAMVLMFAGPAGSKQLRKGVQKKSSKKSKAGKKTGKDGVNPWLVIALVALVLAIIGGIGYGIWKAGSDTIKDMGLDGSDGSDDSVIDGSNLTQKKTVSVVGNQTADNVNQTDGEPGREQSLDGDGTDGQAGGEEGSPKDDASDTQDTDDIRDTEDTQDKGYMQDMQDTAPAEKSDRERILELIGFLEQENKTGLFTYQIIGENSSKSIDLSQHFTDPDDDLLSFSASEVEDIDIVIDGSTADIIPDEGMVGVRFVTFTATDTSGNSVSSPKVTLIVKPYTDDGEEVGGDLDSKGSRFVSFLKSYMYYFIAGIVILIFVIIVMSLLDKPKRRKRRRSH